MDREYIQLCAEMAYNDVIIESVLNEEVLQEDTSSIKEKVRKVFKFIADFIKGIVSRINKFFDDLIIKKLKEKMDEFKKKKAEKKVVNDAANLYDQLMEMVLKEESEKKFIELGKWNECAFEIMDEIQNYTRNSEDVLKQIILIENRCKDPKFMDNYKNPFIDDEWIAKEMKKDAKATSKALYGYAAPNSKYDFVKAEYNESGIRYIVDYDKLKTVPESYDIETAVSKASKIKEIKNKIVSDLEQKISNIDKYSKNTEVTDQRAANEIVKLGKIYCSDLQGCVKALISLWKTHVDVVGKALYQYSGLRD